MEAKDDMHYLCDQEGYTYIYDPEMLSCAAVRSSLGGLTQKQLDGIINV
jgi:hypothetical protein